MSCPIRVESIDVNWLGRERCTDSFDSDYDVFLSPLSDFKKAVDEAGLSDKVVYLDRKDQYRFRVKELM